MQLVVPHEVPLLAVDWVCRLLLSFRPSLWGRVATEWNAAPQQPQRLPIDPERHPVRHEAIPAKPYAKLQGPQW